MYYKYIRPFLADTYRNINLKRIRIAQTIRIRAIKARGFANVVFFANNLSMWRYQGVYEKLRKDERFKLHIVIHPFPSVRDDINRKNAEVLEAFFSEHNMPFIHMKDLPANLGVKSLKPDILFYVQQYNSYLPENVDASYFFDRLIGFIPYGLNTLNNAWNYNTLLQNYGWRMYYANNLLLEDARKKTFCKADNVVVVGDPHGDEFRNLTASDPWKESGNRKRIIWAPHFQIVSNDMFNRPSFLWTYDVMLEIAKKYRDTIHIAFKPHPRLYSELCNHKDWGEQKTKEYYQKWRDMPNTQFEDGEYVELFKTSDALIHGCGSFTAEYQYTKKPCMYLTIEADAIRSELCDFGLRCFNNHYIGTCAEDIENFIRQVVLDGKDEKATDRVKLYDDVLQPINGLTSAENIYNDLVSSLFC